MENNYPEYIMEMLRQRLDLEKDDTSRDEELKKLSSREVVEECFTWEGFLGYTDFIISIIEDAYGIELN